MRSVVRIASMQLVLAVACSPHPPSDGDAGEVVLLPYPPDGGPVVWDGWVSHFVDDYCVQCHNPSAPCSGSGCHPGAGNLPDFRSEAAFISYAPMIQCGIAVQQQPDWDCGTTTPRTFPVSSGSNPLPTDEQRDIMVGWIDAGCP